MDEVFKALSDSSRREILDLLHKNDGQTLTDICKEFPNVTRFAVMKHLKILENALLVNTKKVGKFKYHYLNPIPIQEIADRWISNFSKPWLAQMIEIKQKGETNE